MKSKVALALTGLAFGILIIWQTSYWSRQIALEQISERGRNTLSLIVQSLRGDLDKYRSMPQIHAVDEMFKSALRTRPTQSHLQAVNLELERINNVSGAMDTYLMDAQGKTIAASNWESEKTFIGRNFAYRPYFQAVLEGRLGRYYALGSTSGERGYYFASPVRDAGQVIGAVVVKMHVGQHESSWRTRDHEVIVVDDQGVVFLSSTPEWQLKTLTSLTPEELEGLRQSLQYGDQLLSPLPILNDDTKNEVGRLITIEGESASKNRINNQFLVLEEKMADAEWRVMLLARTKQVDGQVRQSLIIVIVILLSLILAAAAFYQRRHRLADRFAMQEKANEKLELRVEERTNELTQANVELQKEVTERKRAEEEVRKTQETLVQAAKLAALGQMSAGLSHELNQPLAAIRSYADNASTYLDRNNGKTAKKNLKGISELTDRMARIIRNLRTYARDETIELRPTSLFLAIEESLILLDQRIREDGVNVSWNKAEDDFSVMGGDVRLQQIFVNLISNALDAMKKGDKKEIHIEISAKNDNTVLIRVRDTGPGMTDEQMSSIFDPFYSTKEVGQGMGLGLSITFGLVSQFGGAISVSNDEGGGAVFTVELKQAKDAEEAVA